MSDSSNNDQRIHARAPIELKVEYRRLNTFFADYTKNISHGGTFIKTQKPLDIGTNFVFNLYVPTLEEPIVLSGSVQWIIQPDDPSGQQPGMGIQFVYEDNGERTAVESKVEKLMIDSLGKHLYNKLTSSPPPPSTDQ